MLFTDEVYDMNDLMTKLADLNQDLGKIKIAVICFLYDKNGKLILNRRGPGARDEVGKLQALGGSLNVHDKNFREAVLRELKEEAGESAEYEITDFLGAQLDGKMDKQTKEWVNWIIIGYRGNLVSGDVVNMEPDRSIGFERMDASLFKKEELSTTAYNFIQLMLK